jgi:hypothetical protein
MVTTAFMGAEPLQGRRCGRGISQTHAGAAQNAETEDQSQLALHQCGDHAAQGQEETAGGRSDFGAEFILNASAGNHEHGKQDDTDGKGSGCLGVGEIGPARIGAGHDLAGPVYVDQCLFPYAPRIQDAQTKVDGGSGKRRDPSLQGNFCCWLYRHSSSLLAWQNE